MTYITNEQMNVVSVVHDNHEVEFRCWAEENESELMKWYETSEYEKMSMFEVAMKFAYYCAVEFINWKHSGVITEG